MLLKRIAITSLAAAATFSAVAMVGGALTPAAAQLNIIIGAPPPPAVYEVVPAPRVGYVWAPGHYVLVDDRYVWRKGEYIVARPGYRYVPDRWERVVVSGRDHWRYVPSRWDRDGDGIPDRYERHSYNAPWGDKDHDGIPNAYDRHDNRYDYRHW
jgi:hypothetical protein